MLLGVPRVRWVGLLGTVAVGIFAALAILVGTPATGSAVGFFTFTKIADEDTLIPGGTGTLGLLERPVIDSGVVAFTNTNPSESVIVAAPVGGALTTVASNTTIDPVTGLPFGNARFGSTPSFDGSTVAFGTPVGGVYAIPVSGGPAVLLANPSTAIPNGSGTFDSVHDPSIDGGNVMVEGQTNFGVQDGIYSSAPAGASLSVVADLNDVVPPALTSNFTRVRDPSIDGANVAWHGRSGTTFAWFDGIYTNFGSGVSVDESMAIPGGSGTFSGSSVPFGNPSLSGTEVAFIGRGSSSQRGVYLSSGGVVSAVADKNTAIPSGTGNFTSFENEVSLDNGNIAFVGSGSSSQRGLYSTLGGTLQEVIANGALLDGQALGTVWMGEESISGDQIVFPTSVLEGDLPMTGGTTLLFIDPLGRPMSPTSAAGAHRRHRRRAVRHIR